MEKLLESSCNNVHQCYHTTKDGYCCDSKERPPELRRPGLRRTVSHMEHLRAERGLRKVQAEQAHSDGEFPVDANESKTVDLMGVDSSSDEESTKSSRPGEWSSISTSSSDDDSSVSSKASVSSTLLDEESPW